MTFERMAGGTEGLAFRIPTAAIGKSPKIGFLFCDMISMTK